MKRRILSLFMTLAICLSLTPITVMADTPEGGMVIYVGDVNVTNGEYWTTDDEGNVTAYTGAGTPSDNYIHYDATKNILTLYNATIKKEVSSNTNTYVMGAGIGVFNQNNASKLTIQLEGSNAIENVSAGIYVLAHSDSTGDASLTITGSGSLDASGSYNPGIRVQSNGGNATLSIENAKVTATASSSGDGVSVQSKNNSSVSLTVDGGNLTATGSDNSGAGIRFQFGTSVSGSGTLTLTVSNNAIVWASGNAGGIATNSTAATPSGTGIVFDGGTGTVYGFVTLQEDLEISKGESLNIPDESNLTIPEGKTLTVNGGELKGNVPQSRVIYKVTNVEFLQSSLPSNLTVGTTATISVTIKPDNATNQNVKWTSSDESVATVDQNGKVTAVSAGTATITVTTNDGNHSATCTVTVTKKQDTPDNDPIVKPRPPRPVIKEDKDLPSNTAECQKEYGKDYVYSEKYGACIIKYLIIPDTSAK